MFGTRSAATKARNYREVVVLLLLVGLLTGGAVLLWQPMRVGLVEADANRLSGKLWTQSLQLVGAGAPPREVPERFKLQGVIAERFGVLEDPANGELMLHDSNGGVGVNTTSIEEDRAILTHDMLELEQYTEANRKKLRSDAYQWLKKVTHAGAALAFGAPGMPPEAQRAIKDELLAEFHQISSAPTESILNSGKYLELEAVFAKPELAYTTGDLTSDFMRPDPLQTPTLEGKTLSVSSGKDFQLLPSPSTLTLIEQPSLYNTITTSGTLAVTEPKATNTLTSTSTKVSETNLSANTTSGVTAASYYEVTLAPLRESAKTTLNDTTTTPQLSTSVVSGSVTTQVNDLDVTPTTTLVQQ